MKKFLKKIAPVFFAILTVVVYFFISYLFTGDADVTVKWGWLGILLGCYVYSSASIVVSDKFEQKNDQEEPKE